MCRKTLCRACDVFLWTDLDGGVHDEVERAVGALHARAVHEQPAPAHAPCVQHHLRNTTQHLINLYDIHTSKYKSIK